MNLRISVLITILFLSGCATAPIESRFDRTEFVTTTYPNSSLGSASTPLGFNISPAQAYDALNLPIQKNSWSIYADSKNYYLFQNLPLLMATSSYARMYGRRVNGKTGKSDSVMEQ